MIERICREVGHAWRDRRLGPAATVHAFLLQVLHGNTACNEVPHLMGQSFTGTAYCQARARLPLEIFDRLLAELGDRLEVCEEEAARWCGPRVWLVDGSGCSMPDTPELREAFGQPGNQKPGCGFPVAHLLLSFHFGTGMLRKMIVDPLRTHDLAHAHRLHSELEPDDVLVGDRGFCSYAHLALLRQRGCHGVFRAHQKTIVDFRKGRMHVPPSPPFPRRKGLAGLPRSRWVRWLGKCDQIVECHKPRERPRWMSAEDYAALPDSIFVRELRYRVEAAGCRTREIILVTTLLDPERYPAEELAALYGRRWRIETYLGHLKTTLGMDVLRCRSVAGVHKELRMFALVYNLVRLVMLAAAKRQAVPVERISFIDAWRWLRHSRPGRMLLDLVVNPLRPGRLEPRVRKRRPKEFPMMNRPRDELRQTPQPQ